MGWFSEVVPDLYAGDTCLPVELLVEHALGEARNSGAGMVDFVPGSEVKDLVWRVIIEPHLEERSPDGDGSVGGGGDR